MANAAVAPVNPVRKLPRYGIDGQELRLLESITAQCQYNTAEVFGKKILVVDTPGFLDTSLDKDTVNKEIKKCIGLSAPGPHAFLLVTSVLHRFTEEVASVFSEIDAMFRENLKRYLIVIFTAKDRLGRKTIDEFTENAPPKMKEILASAGGGYMAFDNIGKDKEKDEAVETLLCRVEQMVNQNRESHFTSEMFEEAEIIMQERIERELREEKKCQKIQKDLEQTQKRLKKEREYFESLHKQSEEKLQEMKRELEAAKRKEKRKFYSESERELEELVRREMEKVQTKNKLLKQRKEQKGEGALEFERKLAELGNEISQIVEKRKRVEEDVTDEVLSMAVRMEERDKIERNDVGSVVGFFERMKEGVKERGALFLKFFKPSSNIKVSISEPKY